MSIIFKVVTGAVDKYVRARDQWEAKRIARTAFDMAGPVVVPVSQFAISNVGTRVYDEAARTRDYTGPRIPLSMRAPRVISKKDHNAVATKAAKLLAELGLAA